MSRKKVLLSIAGAILALFLAASVLAWQTVVGGGSVEIDTRTTSGLTGTLTFLDQIGTQTGTFEMVVNGSPATVSATISGCMPSNTCTVLASTTSTSNVNLPVSGGPFSNYQIAYTLTGGTAPTLLFNRRATVAKSALGSVVGATASLVNKMFGTQWIEATTQPGSDIETQIANACTALSALGNGGGFITVSFTGTQTGALGHNPFNTCPDSATPQNGTIVYIISPPNGTILTSAPWLTTNKMRLYGGIGGRLARSWTAIQAGPAFKTMANLRKATLATTTGLSRSAGGVVTATFTNTDGGTGCGGAGCGLAFTSGDVLQVGCSTHGDQSFVGTWFAQSANATTVTYNQPQLGAATNSNGPCTIVGGTPIIGLAENGKDYTTSGSTAYGNPNPGGSACTAGTNCYGNATAAFGAGISGFTIDCDDLAGATGCIPIRNVLSQEKTFVDDVSLNNFNFVGLVVNNMNTSGVQNSGVYQNMELYVAPLADAHSDQCDPVNFNDGAGVNGGTPSGTNNNPIPVEAIFAYGLAIRGIHSYTTTMINCGTKSGSTPNFNPGIQAAEFNQTGNLEIGVGGTVHQEGWLTGWAIGTNGPATGGTTIIGAGGPPASGKFTCSQTGCAGGTIYPVQAILISANYATTDVTAINTRRNLGATISILNQIDGDTLSGAADATTAMYAWDVQGANQLLSTTSVTVPNAMQGLKLNRLITLGNSAPSVACTGVGTGSCAVLSNSSDSLGGVQLTVAGGTGAATGVVTLTFTSAMGAHVGSCVWTLSQAGSGQWLTGATPASVFDNGGGSTTVAKAVWYDQATGLANGTYNLNYFCGGHN